MAPTFPYTLQLCEAWQCLRHIRHCIEFQGAQHTAPNTILRGAEAAVAECMGPSMSEDAAGDGAKRSQESLEAHGACLRLHEEATVRLRETEFEMREDVRIQGLQCARHGCWNVVQTKAGVSRRECTGRGQARRAHTH